MSAVKNLEALIKIENDLKAQYQVKLDDKDAEIAKSSKKQLELETLIDQQKQELQKVIDTQLAKISELSTASNDTKRLEQTNREANNRADKLQEDIDSQKKRIKTMQKDLAEERAEIKKLKQFDADKLKKNLVASKKKLAEKTTAADLLQKSLNKTKSENTELQREISELKAKLEELQPEEVATDETPEESVATAA